MKHLVELINEGNIDRCERKYREFVGLCKVYDPDIDIKDICVHKTSKNNWAVYKKEGEGWKKLFIASYFALDDDVIKRNGIELCTESLNEGKEQYYIIYMQYNPDTLKEYENGDTSITDLHDSLLDTDYEYEYFEANNGRDAVRKAESIIKKFVNKHPDVAAGRVCDSYGDIVKDIFI